MNTFLCRRLTRVKQLVAVAAVLGVAAFAPSPAWAQLHGAAVQKACTDAKVGDTVNCTIRVTNFDGFGDSVVVNSVWDVQDSTGDQVRVPAAGSLAITAQSAGAICAAGPSFPCTLTNVLDWVEVKDTSYVVQPDDPDPLPDQGTALVQDLCNVQPTNCSTQVNQVQFTAATTILNPSVTLSKTPDKTTSKVGDTVTYTYVANNTGDTALTGCSIVDNPLGPVAQFDLPVSGSATATLAHPVVQGDPDPLVNTATLTCTVSGRTNQVSASASATVDLIQPAVALTKTPDKNTSKVGDTVTYTYVASNPGTANLSQCSLTDNPLGAIAGPFDLGAGGSSIFTKAHTVAQGDPDPLVNTATLVCTVTGFTNQVTANASATVDLVQPDIALAKSADKTTSKVGDTVNYTYVASNPGTAPLSNCSLTDNPLGAIAGPFDLGAGGSSTFTKAHVVAQGDPNPLVNTATLACTVQGFTNQVSATASFTVNLVNPQVALTKQADKTQAKVGDTVNYTYVASNPGTANLVNCNITDDKASPSGNPFDLPAGASHNATASHVVDNADANPLVNHATVTCSVQGLTNQVSANAQASVNVVKPDFTVSKLCAPDPVSVGGTITWTINLANTGNVDLSIALADATAGINETVNVPAGGNASRTSNRTVVAGDVPSITNTVTATASISGLPNQITKTATATCQVPPEVTGICRTPGFWDTHAGTEKKNSVNITQAVINAAGGSLSVCGETITNTALDDDNSAEEALCVAVQGAQQLQLARQLTAAALNCVISGGGADCSGLPTVPFAQCDAICVANADTSAITGCINALDDFNNGYGIYTGCHERPLVNESLGLDFDPPGPAGSSNECNAATVNSCTIFGGCTY